MRFGVFDIVPFKSLMVGVGINDGPIEFFSGWADSSLLLISGKVETEYCYCRIFSWFTSTEIDGQWLPHHLSGRLLWWGFQWSCR